MPGIQGVVVYGAALIMIMLYPPEGLTESVRQALRERAERGFAEAGSLWLDALPLVYTP